VDLALVLNTDTERTIQELPYKGLMLECASFSTNAYRPPQSVLSSPGLAPNLVMDSIVSDRTGMLRALHQAVERDYARREWVLARCEYEKARTLQQLDLMAKACTPVDVSYHLGYAMNFLSGLMAVSYLQMPTHRRCSILTKQLLEKAGRPELHEKGLDAFGCANMSRSQVESYLQVAIAAFDRAVEVYRTPFHFSYKLHPHVRPYLMEATQEMIDEGYHREAVGWIWFVYHISNAAIQNDAPEEERLQFQAGFDHLLSGLGLVAPEAWPSRLQKAQELAHKIFEIADGVVERNPEIVD
jgi:hypothetical protein